MNGTSVTKLALYRSSVWSTRVDLVVTDGAVVVEAARLLHQTLDRVDEVASRFRPDSEISRLERAAERGGPVAVSAELLEALGIAQRAAALTGGAVDPTVGAALRRIGYDTDFATMDRSRAGCLPASARVPGWQTVVLDVARSTVTLPPGTLLDLGATAKAWAADRAAAVINRQLGCGALVSLGGDIAVAGPAPTGGFAVGIADICGDPGAPESVTITGGGLATSGIGRRHWTLGGHPVHHLVDPATGLPVNTPWRTVSVAAGSCVDANTASTAAMVMGHAAPGWLEDRCLPARLVGRGGEVQRVAAWPEDVVASPTDPLAAVAGSVR